MVFYLVVWSLDTDRSVGSCAAEALHSCAQSPIPQMAPGRIVSEYGTAKLPRRLWQPICKIAGLELVRETFLDKVEEAIWYITLPTLC